MRCQFGGQALLSYLDHQRRSLVLEISGHDHIFSFRRAADQYRHPVVPLGFVSHHLTAFRDEMAVMLHGKILRSIGKRACLGIHPDKGILFPPHGLSPLSAKMKFQKVYSLHPLPK